MNKIQLPNVTLIAMTGLGYMNASHAEALRKSSEKIEFGAIKLIQLGEITNINSWNKAVCYELWKYVDTEFAMFIHSDGYIINPELWQDKWLEYDWCSSPWPLPSDNFSYRDTNGKIQRVGNSVGLRSRKLLRLPSELKLEWKPFFGNFNEDGKFCCEWRTILEQNGCKFMPFEEALKFGKETELPQNKDLKTFLFHQI